MDMNAKPIGSYCPHCLPTQLRGHFADYFEYATELLLWLPIKIGVAFTKNKVVARFISHTHTALNELLNKMGVIQLEESPEESRFLNRSLIFFQEAKKRRILISAVKIFGSYTHQFRVLIQNKPYYYKEIPLLIRNVPVIDIDNKFAFKQFLSKNHFPHAEGRRFLSLRTAFNYGKNLGYPLVVKPVTGSLGFHVTLNIRSDEHFRIALSVVKKYRPDFLIERHVVGDLYRVSVILGGHVFVSRKEVANVVGDGVSTIRKLLRTKNEETNRGRPGQLNATIHQIQITEGTERVLESQHLSLESVPPMGVTVRLAEKAILSQGCDITNLPDSLIHPANRELFQTITSLLRTHIVGFDVLCQDMSAPYTDQSFAFIESNSVPYIDMHQVPSHGTPFPVAAISWSEVVQLLSGQT